MPRSNTSAAPVAHSKVRSVVPAASLTPAPASAPTFGQSIKDGFGMGIGSAIGHRVIASIFGASSVAQREAQREPPVVAQREPTAFEQCIAENRDDIALCAHLAESKQSLTNQH